MQQNLPEIPGWSPWPRQRVAMGCPAFELLYGGTKNAGKTAWSVADCIPLLKYAHHIYEQTGKKQHKVRICYFRTNVKDLRDLFGVKMNEIYPQCRDLGMRQYKNDLLWTAESGAKVECHHLDGPSDHEGFNGHEIFRMYFDQLEQHREDVYKYLIAQIRTTDPLYQDFLAARSTANPGGRNGLWVWKRFIQPCEAGNRILEDAIELPGRGMKKTVTKAFIPASHRDNPFNEDGEWEARIRANCTEDQIQKWIYGNWKCIEGAFFERFVIPEVHFIDSFQVPDSWRLTGSIDWGSTAPAGTLVSAQDQDGRLYFIDEIHAPGRTGVEYGEKMVEWMTNANWCQDRHITPDSLYFLIDKQAMDDVGAGTSPADGISSWGIRLFPADKRRLHGIEQIRLRLRVKQDPDGVPRPGVYVFRDKCPVLCDRLTNIRTNPKDPEDYDPIDESHIVDSMRFNCMDNPVQTYEQPEESDADVQRWLQMIEAKKRQQQMDEAPTIQTGYE